MKWAKAHVLMMQVRYRAEAAGPHTSVSGQVMSEEQVSRGQVLCRTVHVCARPYTLAGEQMSADLSPRSLPPEAKRDCQGPLCESLEHGKHSIVSFTVRDGFQRPGPFDGCSVCLFLLPAVVCCPPWLS